MKDRVSIGVPCDLRYRNAVGALIQQICNRLEMEGEAPGTGYHVVSAFNEAFNNLALYTGDRTERVEVELELTRTQLIMLLKDSGQSFDFDSVEQPPIETLPESGLGIYIIRAAMNEVEYQPGSRDKVNVLRMVKHLQGHPHTHDADSTQGTFNDV